MSLASIAEAVLTVDISGNIDYLNPAAEALLGWQLKDAVGHSLPSVFHAISEASGEAIANPFKLIVQQPQQELRDQAILVTGSGLRQLIIYSAAPIRSAAGEIIRVVLVIKPVHPNQDAAEPPAQNTPDTPAGLCDRSQFLHRLETLIESADCHARQHALLYLNLDQFSLINSTAGRSAGDQLLHELGTLLHGRIRGSDTLARLGDDVFGVLLADCPLDKALRIAQALRASVAEFRFAWQERAYTVEALIGVAPIAGRREDNLDLIGVAKAASQTAKNKARSQVMAGF